MLPRHRRLILLATVAALVGLLRVSIPADSLDARLYYSSAEVYPILAQYGDAGRRLYVWVEYLDLVFIGLYTAFFLKLALTLTGNASSKFRRLSLATFFWKWYRSLKECQPFKCQDRSKI